MKELLKTLNSETQEDLKIFLANTNLDENQQKKLFKLIEKIYNQGKSDGLDMIPQF